MAFKLAAKGVATLEDLADQGIDDLEGIEDHDRRACRRAYHGCA